MANMPKPFRLALPAILATAATVSIPAKASAQSLPGTMDFPAIRHIVAVRCRVCHTAVAQEDGLNATSQPPKGIKFDTPADIRTFATLMIDQAVKTKAMPPDNATHMTDAEREALGKWIEAGAVVP
jgi:uncharacterized membrane protein